MPAENARGWGLFKLVQSWPRALLPLRPKKAPCLTPQLPAVRVNTGPGRRPAVLGSLEIRPGSLATESVMRNTSSVQKLECALLLIFIALSTTVWEVDGLECCCSQLPKQSWLVKLQRSNRQAVKRLLERLKISLKSLSRAKLTGTERSHSDSDMYYD